MTIQFVRRSLTLTPTQWTALEELAAKTGSTSPAGPTAGQPSWRSLIKCIANGDIRLDTTPLSYVEPSITSPAALRDQAIKQPLRTQLHHTSLATVQTYRTAMKPDDEPPNTYHGIAPEIALSVQAASEAEAIQALRAELIRQINEDSDWIFLTGWPAP